MISSFINILIVIASLGIITLSTGIGYSLQVWFIAIFYTFFFAFISTAFMVLLTSLIKSVNAFGAVSGVFGSLIGFASGIYLPLSILPKWIQSFSSIIPFTQMTILLRRAMLPKGLNIITEKLTGNMPESEMTELNTALKEVYGYNKIGIFGLDIPIFWVMIISVIVSIGLLWLATYLLNKRIKN